MINRVVTLTELSGNPRENQFRVVNSGLGDVKYISTEAGGFYICYGSARAKRHKWTYILWKHSTGLYCAFSRRTSVGGTTNDRQTFLEAAPRSGLRLRAYCNQATHSWRVYYASGTGPIDQMGGGTVIGPVTNRLTVFASQPPATVSVAKPWTVGTFVITSIQPTIGITLSGFNLPLKCTSVVDETDNGD